MKYLLLVSHGDFATGLKTSLAMFAEDKIDQVIAVGLKMAKQLMTLKRLQTSYFRFNS